MLMKHAPITQPIMAQAIHGKYGEVTELAGNDHLVIMIYEINPVMQATNILPRNINTHPIDSVIPNLRIFVITSTNAL